MSTKKHYITLEWPLVWLLHVIYVQLLQAEEAFQGMGSDMEAGVGFSGHVRHGEQTRSVGLVS